ncbi:phosphotransferase family protein [Gandjariella thermophila]|uniref:Acyl-CoA dehydrogenase n=1 Tax=Gandjariella thermophila TaxID=1931992 RepID=A0A4D4J562_9PSEU|nr:phosphotransferase family protein [Gandjariella thermophila]GDY29103.1 acyl-CoA dehydrogenase [Gandjariella thermophila]
MSDSELPGLDLERLRAHLNRELPGLVGGPLRGEVIAGGRSNLTYSVTDGASRWVVRRPPLGHVLATAHDMGREYRVVSALRDTAVPVPNTLLRCDDPEVIGAPFYVMEFVEGTPYRRSEELAALGPERTRAIGLSLVDTLVDLHAVNPAEVGLADFGRPEGFLERQVRRWKKQLDASRSRDVPGVDELHDRLAASVPVSPAPAIVHGDYRLDNVLVDAGDRITAVLDWEMSTLGDPLTDLALLVAYAKREMPSGEDSPVANASGAPGYPPVDEVVARYAERSGRDVSTLDWYVAFAFFKLAVILEGIHYRFGLGQTVGAGFDRVGELVPPLVEYGLTTLKEES